MSLPQAKTWRVRLRCDRSAPRLARKALHWLETSSAAGADVVLVTSELVSSAVLDTGCNGEHEIDLVAEVRPQTVRLRVVDAGRCPDRAAGNDGLVLGGPRLRVVQALTRRWGTEPGDRLRLWAELAL